MKKIIISALAILAIAFAVYGMISLESRMLKQPQRQENSIKRK